MSNRRVEKSVSSIVVTQRGTMRRYTLARLKRANAAQAALFERELEQGRSNTK